ncbi:MAG: hypothetical protein AAGA17_11470 [Actinomycetota bacterium]
MEANRSGKLGICFVATTPAENDTFAPRAATTPTRSTDAPGRTTTMATPMAAATPTTTSRRRITWPVTTQVMNPTSSGWTPPIDAATPPGSRYTATISRGKNSPKLHAESRTSCRHCARPGHGAARQRAMATRTRPAGSSRDQATSSGRPSGNSSVTVT